MKGFSMDRVLKVMSAVNHHFEKEKNIASKSLLNEMMHTYGAGYLSAAIASARGLNMELAFITGILHDIGKLKKDTDSGISHNVEGAKIAKEILTNLNSFTHDEIEIICQAICNHPNKKVIDTEYDEVIKDADVIEKLFIERKKYKNKRYKRRRLEKTFGEFGLELYHKEG